MDDKIEILIVDDDPEILFAAARVVKSLGHPVTTASSGAGCLEAARKRRPDLILLDVVLPDADGAALCAELKADPLLGGPYVILISGMKTASEEQADGLDGGADGYIARPVSNRELKARVNAMVRILKAERERDRLIAELSAALAKIKKLSGLLPICSFCKQIRNDRGYWSRLEEYLQDHADVRFSHGVCPDCAKKHYAGLSIYEDEG